MMLQVPAAVAVTSPVEASTVATLALLLLHAPVPPLITVLFAENEEELPAQRGEVPVTEPMPALG